MSGPSILPQPRATEFRRDNLRLGDLYIVPGDWSGSSCNGPGSNLTRIVELGESTFSYLTASGRTEHSERYEDAKGVVVRVTEGELEIVSGSAHLNNLSGVDATLSGADPTTEQISRLAYNKRFST